MKLTDFAKSLLAERRAQRGILPKTDTTRRGFDYMASRYGEQYAKDHYAANGLKLPENEDRTYTSARKDTRRTD